MKGGGEPFFYSACSCPSAVALAVSDWDRCPRNSRCFSLLMLQPPPKKSWGCKASSSFMRGVRWRCGAGVGALPSPPVFRFSPFVRAFLRALLHSATFGFLLSLAFDLFSPSVLSLGPWQLLSQCFSSKSPLEEGDGFGREGE